ncbi:MAG: tetratricopeptide repeat protein [Alistipes sp.]
MQRKTILLLALFLCAFASIGAQAATPETHAVIARATSLFEAGRWTDARHELLHARAELAATDIQERQQVDYYLAACAVELGSADAEAALQRFSERYPNSIYNNDVRFSLASYYCTRGDMKRAERLFSEVNYAALSADRKQQYNMRRGYVEFANGRYDQAYTYFDKIDSHSDYADHALYYKSYIAYSRGEYAQAKQGFSTLLKSDTYGAVIPYYLLQIEFKQGNYRYVTEQGDALLQQATGHHRLELGRTLAESWFHLEDYAKTAHYLNAYVAAGGELGRDENYLIGFSLYRSTRYAEAEEYLRRACGADDALTQNASYHLADCYLRSGEKQSAMQSFAMASNEAYNPQIAEEALFNYGKLQYETGGGVFNEAINVLGRYMNKYPTSKRLPEVRNLLIAAYYNSHNYDAAYQAIKQHPNPDNNIKAAMQKITYFRGLESYAKGELTQAKQYLAESATTSVSPKYTALAAFWLGEIAFAQEDFNAAVTQYNAYLVRAPKNTAEYALAYYNLGYCALAQQDRNQAQQAFSRFLSLHPTADFYRTDAQNRLGDAYYSDRAFEQAAKQYEVAAAATDQGRYYAQYQRAVTLGILGRTAPKIEALKQIMQVDKGDYIDDATYNLGHTYIEQEQYNNGASVLEKFVTRFPSSPLHTSALSDLGLAYLNLGDRQKSLKYYDLIVTTAPQSAEAKDAMQGIREIYVADGKVDAYFTYAEKVGMETDLTEMTRDSLSYLAAQRFYLNGNHDDAEKSLRSYIKSYPKGYYITDALFCLSDCYLKTNEREPAIETLTQLAEQSTGQYTPKALDKLAQLTFEDHRYAEAATAYRKLYDVSHTATTKADAMTGYVRACVAEGDAAKIVQMADDVAACPAAGATAQRESQFAQMQQLRKQGKHAQATKICKKLSSEAQTLEGATSTYYVIEDLFAGGELQKAEDAIYAFTAKNSPHAYWLAKAYILLGDIYVRRGDTFQARATYQSIADGYSPADDGIIAEAKERIQNLK